MSVDPEWDESTPKVPQRWNRYSYGVANPLLYVDYNGRTAVKIAVGKGLTRSLGVVGALILADQANAAEFTPEELELRRQHYEQYQKAIGSGLVDDPELLLLLEPSIDEEGSDEADDDSDDGTDDEDDCPASGCPGA